MSVWIVTTPEPDSRVVGLYVSWDAVKMKLPLDWEPSGEGTGMTALAPERYYAAEHELQGEWPTLDEEPIMALHRYLFPERYDASIDTYQWHAGTIEDVAGMIERALKGHPRAKLWAE